MDPLKLAEQLGEAIVSSEEYKAYKKAKQDMDSNRTACSLIFAFEQEQQELRNAEAAKKDVLPSQLEDLRQMQSEMLQNDKVDAYLKARNNMEVMLRSVNEKIAQVTGMETGHTNLHGHCGGGCCGK